MLKPFVAACFFQILIISAAGAAGPFGSIHVGNWTGGAFSDDNTGAFSHCAATGSYGNGISLVVGQNAGGSWLLSFASPAFHFNKGDSTSIDLTFDGEARGQADRRAEGRTQDGGDRKRRARLYAVDLLHRDRAGRRQAVSSAPGIAERFRLMPASTGRAAAPNPSDRAAPPRDGRAA